MYDFGQLEKFLDELIARGTPYCEMSLRRGHEELFRAERGEGGHGKRFFLYSCSKPITAAGAMRLVERGLLDLDAPVCEYLPAYKNAFLLENGQRRAPKTVMTVRNLFTMSAGLDYNFNTEPVKRAAAKPDATTVSVANAFIESPLSFDPGDKFQYSLCHDALGAVIETVSGKSFAQYLHDEVFVPLGMNGTSFEFAPEELAPQFHYDDATKSALPSPPTNCFMLAKRCYSGGAGVVSTLSDLALFVDALACGGTAKTGYELLRRETVDAMRSEQLSHVVKDPSFGCAAGPGYGYALGVRTPIDKSGGQMSSLGEFGWDGAAGAYEMCDPETGISIAYVMHVLGWPGLLGCPHAVIRDLSYRAIL